MSECFNIIKRTSMEELSYLIIFLLFKGSVLDLTIRLSRVDTNYKTELFITII